MTFIAVLLNILVLLIALAHVYFMALEMFWWTQDRGLRVNGLTLREAEDTKVLAANQGLYNGFLALGLLWSLSAPNPQFATQLKWFFLGCVALAGTYGGATANKRIYVVQALPAFIALALLMLAR